MPTVFIDGQRVLLDTGATAIDGLRQLHPAHASDVEAGERVITDSRGLPIRGDSPAYDGAIYRVVRARKNQATDYD